MSTPSRYHPLLVILHWLLAVLVIMMLGIGLLSLKWMPNNPAKLLPLGFHMATGITILVLMIIRFIVRIATQKPEEVSTGNAFLDRLATAVHWLMYVGVILMAVSGLGVSNTAGLVQIVFMNSGAPLPEDFFVFPVRYAHGYIAIFLIVLIALHVGAWLYHQFIRKDNLFARMWFGK